MKKSKYPKTEITYKPKELLTVRYGINLSKAKSFYVGRILLIITGVVAFFVLLFFPMSVLLKLIVIGLSLLMISYTLNYLNSKSNYIQYTFTPTHLIYTTFLNGKSNTETIPIWGVSQIYFEVYKEDDLFYLEAQKDNVTWFDNELELDNLHIVLEHFHDLYSLKPYDKERINKEIKRSDSAKFNNYSLPYISESTQDEFVEYIENESLIIKEKSSFYNEFSSAKITFTPTKIEAYQNKAAVVININNQLPFLFIITITQNETNLTISIHNFHHKLITLEWTDIEEIPTITDGLIKMYDLQYFGGKQIDKNTEQLMFNSHVGMKSHQLFKVRDRKYDLLLDFQDVINTQVRFDWLRMVLEKSNPKPFRIQTIHFGEIKEIVFYLRHDKKYFANGSDNHKIYFNKFALIIQTKEEEIVLTEIFNVLKHDILSGIPAHFFFQAIISVISILKSKSELEKIDISIKTDDS